MGQLIDRKHGGPVNKTGPIMAHKGEYVLNADQARVGARRGTGRTPSGAAKSGGESAAYDAEIADNMDERVKEAAKSKGRKRALGRMK